MTILTEIDHPSAFWREAQSQRCCAYCGRAGYAWEAHHVVYLQHCRRLGAPHYSPDNALRTCAGQVEYCHNRHHSAQERIGLCSLRGENIAFAVRWLGPGPAFEYLNRYYGGSDPRVDALLEQP